MTASAGDAAAGGRPVLDTGFHVVATWRDGTLHAGTVIERRSVEGGMEYYIHFDDYDRRLDEWVEENRIDWNETISQRKGPGAGVIQRRLSVPASGAISQPDRKMTRNMKRKHDEINHVQKAIEEMDPTTALLEKEHKEMTKVKFINKIQLGRYEVDTWYFSPYPEEYGRASMLYICEFTLKYMRFKRTYTEHKARLERFTPPGREIYRNGHVSVFEIDGNVDKVYCQNLCLLAKLFLDHKTLYFDVAPFLFYVVCEVDEEGCHPVGYFSKEKHSVERNNLACILTFPPFQRKGYGSFLIEFSYLLSRVEEKIGSPEKPLSDLGQLSYRSYWSRIILQQLDVHCKKAKDTSLSIRDLSLLTWIKPEDIRDTLQSLNLVKYWKGHHVMCVTPKLVEGHLKNFPERSRGLKVVPAQLQWVPPVYNKDE